MDSSPSRWFSDPVMDDPSFHQWELDSLDQFNTAQNIWDDIQQSLSSESYNSFNNPNSSITSNTLSTGGKSSMDSPEKPKKMPKTSSWSSDTPSILSFGDPDSPTEDQHELYKSILRVFVPEEEPAVKPRKAAVVATAKTIRLPSQNHDHIIAERKRREKISQRFIALSAIVPGLKKMDKASVLGDAIKYLKQLQEKVKTLEEQSAQKPVESAVLVKKAQLSKDGGSSSDENFGGPKANVVDDENKNINDGDDNNDDNNKKKKKNSMNPEIEAKLTEKSVLLRIHCRKSKGVLLKALREIERLNLSIVNTSCIPFTSSALDITVMAEMEEGFCLTMRELVKKLGTAFKQFM